ncbi:nitroreductase family protein [Fructobacillus papyrifericola]|uniref:Nitroreductase family protein n=1 Tax=Fructobacillus papyrifericola TaxID=2713172 RepID=A0ABS5QTW8_9LACO|nr:nitroreductase family protein [Fructobacillus papyrifericola]MBS9336639.1 nitroreductase family protein [Fructobacillus papyrifericola]
MSTFNELQAKRRSIYALGKEVNKTDEELFNLVKTSVKNSPSPFNSQSVQAVLLTGASHEKLWEMTLTALKEVSPSEEAFAATTAKVKGAFQSGYGTVLYFTDRKIVDGLKEQAPLYADNFDDWAEEAMGIGLYSVWMALAEAGIGASLQHYNPLIDEAVKEAFNIPDSWVLRGQMPFGSIEAPADEKTYLADDARFKLFQ